MMLVYSVYCIRVGLHDIQVFNQRPQGCNNPAQCIQFDRMFSAPGTRCPGKDVFCSWYQVSWTGCFLLLVLGVLDRMFYAPGTPFLPQFLVSGQYDLSFCFWLCLGQDVWSPGQDYFFSWSQESRTRLLLLLVLGVPDKITFSLGPRSPGQVSLIIKIT